MQIKVLGPVEAVLNGRSVTPTAAKPRQILALLALNSRQVVSVPTLVEELWGDRPPRSARTTLQTYILQLRKLIGDALSSFGENGAKEVLVTRYGGYLLDVPPESVDVHEFERVARAGQQAYDVEDYASASRLLRQALDMWRGTAVVDVRPGMPLGIEVVRLEEARLSALETRIDAELRMGKHTVLLSELSVLSVQNPMNENLCAQYMISLFRAGRQWQALDAFKALHTTLNRELGVEPSSRLQLLQHAILTSDPRLDSTETVQLQRLLA
ncbi:AfsR/SARP family transcriptional regulator [Lentzea jiangxiensis]|uniref:DNA-binding transcriptional activator of the SARP family n=1 Tax=Lentzea jiangxiensis TaxID=641025 RepID=A0A1H0U9J6_9PSEU|nr:AfsR/SARP family transcriptional regulator [Lentzea jiangxiensis]SDP62839.1 DNA-binding transcriptional activator of the SARP family [Lentzea jiangxiensis]